MKKSTLIFSLIFFMLSQFSCQAPDSSVVDQEELNKKRLIIFADALSLKDTTWRLDLLKALVSYTTSDNAQPLTVELYQMGGNKGRLNNLLPNCEIKSEELKKIRLGGRQTLISLQNKLKADIINLASNHSGQANILGSISTLKEVLQSNNIDNAKLRILYITDWLEMAETLDIDKELYQLLDMDIRLGAFSYNEDSINELYEKISDEHSKVVMDSKKLAKTAKNQGLKEIFHISPSILKIEANTVMEQKCNLIWEKIFTGHAKLKLTACGSQNLANLLKF